MESNAVVDWFSRQLFVKRMQVQSLKDLKSGCLFMQVLHIYFPKLVNLSKVYLKPKNSFQVAQNYKQLSNAFKQLKWKKIDPEKYVKQQDKDCLNISNLIISNINKQKHIKRDQIIEHANAEQIDNVSEISIINKSLVDFGAQSVQNQSQSVINMNIDGKLQQLENYKKKLLQKIMKVQQIVLEGTNGQQNAKMILHILQQ